MTNLTTMHIISPRVSVSFTFCVLSILGKTLVQKKATIAGRTQKNFLSFKISMMCLLDPLLRVAHDSA